MPPAFPRVDPGTARQSNQWLRPRQGLTVTLAGHAFSMMVMPWPLDDQPRLGVVFQLGGDKGVLHLPPAWLARTLGGQCAASVEHARLEQRCLLLEYLFLGALESLEKTLGERLNFTAEPCPAQRLPVCLGVRLSAAAASATLGVELSQGAAARLFDAFDANAPVVQALPATVPFSLEVHNGWQYLSQDELDSLRSGDVVMLDRLAEGVRVQVAGCLQASATPVAAGLRLDEALLPISSHRETLMEQSSTMSVSGPTEAPPLDTAQWPVTLVCEAGRVELSLQALGELVPGSVLALPGSTGEQVKLRANGRLFGQGELVWLGESLGVRLTRLAGDE
jgi:type III secretion protein Q